ncbi:MAG: hypothetical protein HQL56_02505 [Magnetococcales bacterium]|nr:hypothetical protein [Magnetococcales bacterium]
MRNWVVLLVVLYGCNIGASESDKSVASCPTHDFYRFARMFIESEKVQKAYISGVLEHTIYRNMKGVFRANISSYKQGDVPQIVMDGIKSAKSRCLSISVNKYSPRRGVVSANGVDSGVSILYLFVRRACWELVGVEDWSDVL